VSGELILVKLGGSVITDKTRPETPRLDVIHRLAREVASARETRPGLRLILGHGSGSFGHFPALRFNTRQGVATSEEWAGFAQVAAAAASLNRLVVDAFLEEGVPVWSVQPSASALCQSGALVSLDLAPIQAALERGLVPLVYGDVALDSVQGGTIISTEQIFGYLAHRFQPSRMLLAGVVEGVFDADPLREPSASLVPEITPGNWASVRQMLGGSHGSDVTGGMVTKVEEMVALAQELPGLTIQILSGERPEALYQALLEPERPGSGTRIQWS
jgi:isopentenyl phosphate kinase